MLEFDASDYVELTYHIGLMLGNLNTTKPSVQTLTDQWGKLLAETTRLGLPVTKAHLGALVMEYLEANPGKSQLKDGKVHIVDATIDTSRSAHHLEAIYTSLRAELEAMQFRAIPKESARLCDPEWLRNTEIPNKFPTSLKELQRAGSCFALGEPTACVFHCMRALEPALNSLARAFCVPFQHQNWQTVIELIESEARKIGQQPKSQQKLEDEKFFGSATSHLYFVKNAWRNHVAHGRDTYIDKEAMNILDKTVQFIESLCAHLSEPNP